MKSSLRQLFLVNDEDIRMEGRISPKWALLGIIGYVVLIYGTPRLFDDVLPRILIPTALAIVWIVAVVCKAKASGETLNSVLELKALRSGDALKVLLTLLGICITSVVMMKSCEALFDWVGIDYQREQELLKILQSSSLEVKLAVGVLCSVFAPVGEEIVFRRLLFGLLEPLGHLKAAVYCAFLFGLLHFFLLGFMHLFFMGLFLEFLFMKTKNLWLPIQVHVINNLLVFVVSLSGIGGGD